MPRKSCSRSTALSVSATGKRRTFSRSRLSATRRRTSSRSSARRASASRQARRATAGSSATSTARWGSTKRLPRACCASASAPRRRQKTSTRSSPRSKRTAIRASPCCNFNIRGFYVLLSSPAQGLLQTIILAGAAGHFAESDHHVSRLSRYVHGGSSRQRSDVRRHGGKCAGVHHPAHRLRPAKRLERAHQSILGPRRPREHQPRHGDRLYDRRRGQRAVCSHSVRVPRTGALPHHR